MTSQINAGETSNSSQLPIQQQAGAQEKTKFLPLILNGGRVTVAPVVKWENLGEAFGERDPSVERREWIEKARALRALAADLIEQAQSIENSLSQSISQADAQADEAASILTTKRPRP